jgi:hypothetical protein
MNPNSSDIVGFQSSVLVLLVYLIVAGTTFWWSSPAQFAVVGLTEAVPTKLWVRVLCLGLTAFAFVIYFLIARLKREQAFLSYSRNHIAYRSRVITLPMLRGYFVPSPDTLHFGIAIGGFALTGVALAFLSAVCVGSYIILTTPTIYPGVTSLSKMPQCQTSLHNTMFLQCGPRAYFLPTQSCKVPWFCTSDCDVETSPQWSPVVIRSHVATAIGGDPVVAAVPGEPKVRTLPTHWSWTYFSPLLEVASMYWFWTRTRLNRYQVAYRFGITAILGTLFFSLGVLLCNAALSGHTTLRSPYNLIGGPLHAILHLNIVHAASNALYFAYYSSLIAEFRGLRVLVSWLALYWPMVLTAAWLDPSAFRIPAVGASGVVFMLAVAAHWATWNYSSYKTSLALCVLHVLSLFVQELTLTGAAHHVHLWPMTLATVVVVLLACSSWLRSSKLRTAGAIERALTAFTTAWNSDDDSRPKLSFRLTEPTAMLNAIAEVALDTTRDYVCASIARRDTQDGFNILLVPALQRTGTEFCLHNFPDECTIDGHHFTVNHFNSSLTHVAKVLITEETGAQHYALMLSLITQIVTASRESVNNYLAIPVSASLPLVERLTSAGIAPGAFVVAPLTTYGPGTAEHVAYLEASGSLFYFQRTIPHNDPDTILALSHWIFYGIPTTKWSRFVNSPSYLATENYNRLLIFAQNPDWESQPEKRQRTASAVPTPADALKGILGAHQLDALLQVLNCFNGIKNSKTRTELAITLMAFASGVYHSSNPVFIKVRDVLESSLQTILDNKFKDPVDKMFDEQVADFLATEEVYSEPVCVGDVPSSDDTPLARAHQMFGMAKKTAGFITIATLIGKNAVLLGPRAVNMMSWLGAAIDFDDAVSSVISVVKVAPAMYRYVVGTGSPDEMLKFGDKAAVHAFHIDRAVSAVQESPNDHNMAVLNTVLFRATLELAKASGPSAMVLKAAVSVGTDVLNNAQRNADSAGAPGIWFTGVPGIGKSQMSTLLGFKIAMSLGHKPKKQCVLGFISQGGNGDKFDSGVPPGSDVVIMDDPVASAQSTDQVTSAIKMMAIMDPKALLNKAELSQKGTAVSPWAVIVSTNHARTDYRVVSDQVLREPRALTRRLGIRVTCVQTLQDISTDQGIDHSKVRWIVGKYDAQAEDPGFWYRWLQPDGSYSFQSTANQLTSSQMIRHVTCLVAAIHAEKDKMLTMYSEEQLMEECCDQCYAIEELCHCLPKIPTTASSIPTPAQSFVAGALATVFGLFTLAIGAAWHYSISGVSETRVAEMRVFRAVAAHESREHYWPIAYWRAYQMCTADALYQPEKVTVQRVLVYDELSAFVKSKLFLALSAAVCIAVVGGVVTWSFGPGLPTVAGNILGKETSSQGSEAPPDRFYDALYLVSWDSTYGRASTNALGVSAAVLMSNSHSFPTNHSLADCRGLRIRDGVGKDRDVTQVTHVNSIAHVPSDSSFVMSAHVVRGHLKREMMADEGMRQHCVSGTLKWLDPDTGRRMALATEGVLMSYRALDPYKRHVSSVGWRLKGVVPNGACNGVLVVDDKIVGLIQATDDSYTYVREFSWKHYSTLADEYTAALPLPGIPMSESEAVTAGGFRGKRGCGDTFLPLPAASWKKRYPASKAAEAFDHIGSFANDVAEPKGSGRVPHPDVSALESATGILQRDYMPVTGCNWSVGGRMVSILETNLHAAAECLFRETPLAPRVPWKDLCDGVRKHVLEHLPGYAGPMKPLTWLECIRGVPGHVGPTDPSTSAGPGEGPKREWFYREPNEAWMHTPGLSLLCDRLMAVYQGPLQPLNIVRMTPKTGEVLKCTKVQSANTRVFYQNGVISAFVLKSLLAPILAVLITLPAVGSIYGINMYSRASHELAKALGADVPGKTAVAADDAKMDLHQLFMLLCVLYVIAHLVATTWHWPYELLLALRKAVYALQFPWVSIRGSLYQWRQGLISGVYGTTEINTFMTFLKMACIALLLQGRAGFDRWCASAKALYGDDQLMDIHPDLSVDLTPEVWRSYSLGLGYETTSERDKTQPPGPGSLLDEVTILKRTLRKDVVAGEEIFLAPLAMSSIVKAMYYPKKDDTGSPDVNIFADVCKAQEREVWLHGRVVYDRVVPAIAEAARVVGARYAPSSYEALEREFVEGKFALWSMNVQ